MANGATIHRDRTKVAIDHYWEIAYVLSDEMKIIHSFINLFLYYSKCQNAFVVTNNIDILRLC